MRKVRKTIRPYRYVRNRKVVSVRKHNRNYFMRNYGMGEYTNLPTKELISRFKTIVEENKKINPDYKSPLTVETVSTVLNEFNKIKSKNPTVPMTVGDYFETVVLVKLLNLKEPEPPKPDIETTLNRTHTGSKGVYTNTGDKSPKFRGGTTKRLKQAKRDLELGLIGDKEYERIKLEEIRGGKEVVEIKNLWQEGKISIEEMEQRLTNLTTSVAGRINELKKLFDAGKLTKEEYIAKSKEAKESRYKFKQPIRLADAVDLEVEKTRNDLADNKGITQKAFKEAQMIVAGLKQDLEEELLLTQKEANKVKHAEEIAKNLEEASKEYVKNTNIKEDIKQELMDMIKISPEDLISMTKEKEKIWTRKISRVLNRAIKDAAQEYSKTKAEDRSKEMARKEKEAAKERRKQSKLKKKVDELSKKISELRKVGLMVGDVVEKQTSPKKEKKEKKEKKSKLPDIIPASVDLGQLALKKFRIESGNAETYTEEEALAIKILENQKKQDEKAEKDRKKKEKETLKKKAVAAKEFKKNQPQKETKEMSQREFIKNLEAKSEESKK